MAKLPSNYVFGILIFTLICVGGVSIMASLYSYDATLHDPLIDKFNNSVNKLTDVQSAVGDIQGNIEGTENDPKGFGILDNLISGAWNTLRLFFNSFGFMNDALKTMTTLFGVPAWISGLVISIIVAALAFAIYSAIFQKDI